MKYDDFKQIILNSSSPYLIAPKGVWINGNRDQLFLEEMDQGYMKNCYEMLIREKESIKYGYFLNGVSFNQADLKEIVSKAMELYDVKLQELADEVKRGMIHEPDKKWK